MSRLFDDATPDYLQSDTAIVSAAPMTVSAWIRLDDLSSDQVFFWCGDKDDPTEAFTLQFDNSNQIEWRTIDGSGGARASTSTGVTIDTWHHIAGTEISTTSRAAWIDGGSKGTNSSTRSPSGTDRTAIGMSRDSSPSRETSGNIAHVAVWDAVLSDSEIASLAAGVSPLRIRRGSLIAYWPLNGQSPEIDVVGSLNLTLFGPPTVDFEPPVPFSIIAP
jgi:hypothetical protein